MGFRHYSFDFGLGDLNVSSLLEAFARSDTPHSIHGFLRDRARYPRNRSSYLGCVKTNDAALFYMTRRFPSVDKAKRNEWIAKFVGYVEFDGDPRPFANLQLSLHGSESLPCSNCSDSGEDGQGPLRPSGWPEGGIPIEPTARFGAFIILFFVGSRMAFLWGYDRRRYGGWLRISITWLSMLTGFAFLLVPGFALLVWKLCFSAFAWVA